MGAGLTADHALQVTGDAGVQNTCPRSNHDTVCFDMVQVLNTVMRVLQSE